MRKQAVTQENISPRIVCKAPWRLSKVKPLANYNLEVEFNDGVQGIVEMVKLIMSDRAGVFAILKDQDIFNKAYLEYGVLTWPGAIDLAPDAMHDEIKKYGRCVL
jgi:hypothetical protein